MHEDPTEVDEARDLLRELGESLSERRLRLFSLACIRRFDCFLDHPNLEKTRTAMLLLERHLDGAADAAQFEQARVAALAEIDHNVMEQALDNWTASDLAHVLFANPPLRAAERHIALTQDFQFDVVVDHLPDRLSDEKAWKWVTGPVRAQLCAWLHDLSTSAEFQPEWRSKDAVVIAGEMYQRQDFIAMPVLGEALREAGCGHPAVLEHCRKVREHIRGCWVVDGVLGKS